MNSERTPKLAKNKYDGALPLGKLKPYIPSELPVIAGKR